MLVKTAVLLVIAMSYSYETPLKLDVQKRQMQSFIELFTGSLLKAQTAFKQ